MPLYKYCKICNKIFFKKVNCSIKDWENRKFCSIGCTNDSFLKVPRIVTCKNCGKKFRRNTKDGMTKVKFCSLDCRHKFYSGKNHPKFNINRHSSETILCACGCGTEIPKYDNKGRIKKYVVGHTMKGKRRKFTDEWRKNISKSNTRNEKIMGKNHWNWKGGVTGQLKSIRHSKEYREWRLMVYRKDHFSCQECGKHCNEHQIIAHHIKDFKNYPKLRFDVNNGITLCRKCHLALHRKLKALL
jgi:5-methylcytosine-specific restriction endonuclease McrA/ribosomal protein L32